MNARALNAADLLVGVRTIELRIAEKRFEARDGEPDALHVIMSSGVAFCVLHTVGGTYNIEFEGELLETLAAEERITGLGRAQLNALGEEAARKFGDDMSVVIDD